MEDRENQARGHKAALSNPNVSKEAKRNSREILHDEFDNETGYPQQLEHEKNPGNVAGGLKSAMSNPQVSEEAKENAEERLEDIELGTRLNDE